MPLSNAELKRRLHLAALLVLVLGLTSALLVYVFIDDAPPEPGAYIIVDGMKYPVDPSLSKRYKRDLERFGGKTSVVMDEFSRWLGRLWEGRQLAVTLAFLSVAGSLLLLAFAHWLPHPPGRRRDPPAS